MSSLQLCMDLSNVITSLKRRLLRLGFLILKKFNNIDCAEQLRSDE